ncbi:MAG: SpoIID/LytB domain-containing protein [Hyphomonadaceae bacterium]|nr:SpoIID/LytB domain-containing protein [Clostridia bacterium]
MIKRLIAVMIVFLCTCIPAFAAPSLPQTIRIGLYFEKSAVSSIPLTFTNGFEAGVWQDEKLAVQFTYAQPCVVKASKSTANANEIVLINEKGETIFTFPNGDIGLDLMPIAGADGKRDVTIDKVTYHGGVELKRLTNSDMTVINRVPFEQYLYNVVPYELSASYPIEALKAQAIAARTYAARNINRYKKFGFDMDATTNCQVYFGTKGEHVNSNLAVDSTKGQVLTYEGKLIEALFFASDGGYTEDSVNVWGGVYPYFKATRDPYETADIASKYEYNVEMTAQKVGELMQSKGYDLGDILSVQAEQYSPSGRVIKLTVQGTKDKKTVEREGARTLLGLHSQKYKIITDAITQLFIVQASGQAVAMQKPQTVHVMTADGVAQTNGQLCVQSENGVSALNTGGIPTVYRFVGNGYGHAIGMSQIGAVGMAKQGFTYDKILQFYYQGVTIE